MPAKESARAERDSASRSSFAGKETGPMIRNASIRGNLLRVTDPRSCAWEGVGIEQWKSASVR
jgi:hypothetical protein